MLKKIKGIEKRKGVTEIGKEGMVRKNIGMKTEFMQRGKEMEKIKKEGIRIGRGTIMERIERGMRKREKELKRRSPVKIKRSHIAERDIDRAARKDIGLEVGINSHPAKTYMVLRVKSGGNPTVEKDTGQRVERSQKAEKDTGLEVEIGKDPIVEIDTKEKDHTAKNGTGLRVEKEGGTAPVKVGQIAMETTVMRRGPANTKREGQKVTVRQRERIKCGNRWKMRWKRSL